MKRIILSVVVLAFVATVRAEDAKACQASKDKEMPSCCAGKVKTSTQAKGACPYAKSACCKDMAKARPAVLLSPKASDLASK